MTILGVAQLNAIVEHAHVVGAHGANVDGLHAAHTAVVLDLHTREITNSISHTVAVESLQSLTAKRLGRNHLLIRFLSIDHHIFKILH